MYTTLNTEETYSLGFTQYPYIGRRLDINHARIFYALLDENICVELFDITSSETFYK